MPFVSNYVLSDRGNFHLELVRRFKDVAVFAVGSFSLPRPYIIGRRNGMVVEC